MTFSGDGESVIIDFDKKPLSDAGKIFKKLELDYFGILIDYGADEGGKRRYKILSDEKVLI